MSMFVGVDPLYILSGFLVGLLVGQTGVGGGSLMTPVLVLLFGVHPATAVGTDLLFAAATKSVGTMVHGLNHTIDWRITGRLASGSVPAAAITLIAVSHFGLSGAVGNEIISIGLAIMLLLAAALLVFRQRLVASVGPTFARISGARSARLTILTGALLGVFVTISSVGAGALGVTALLLLYPGRPIAVIVGSDIAHAVPLTLLAGLGHWWIGSVDWPLLALLLSGSIPGIIIGGYLSAYIPEFALRPIMAVTLVIAGLRLAL